VAVDDDATTAEDTAVIIYVLDNDYDVDGESLSLMASGLGQPAHGTVVRTTPTYVTYTPDPNYHGPDSFTYMVSDGHGGSDEGAVSVTVTPVSDPPVLNPIGDKSIDEGQELTFTLEADDPDVGDTLTYSATLPLPSGASLNSTTGVFVWLPDFLQSGNYTIEFEVTDGTFTDSETINIEVVDVNRPPVADANGPYTMEVAEPIHLDGSGSVDPDAPLDHIVTYDWDMNMDGVYEKTTSDAVCVVFWDDLYAWRSGNIVIGQPFDIRLRVTDSNGATD
ncbi:MAG: tandem-95 repeat protein, partial [Armatimonadetes bacterium]|nr:tandem-95 repeat protein [Armatimonadota bacterium]